MSLEKNNFILRMFLMFN